jgi:hypothetical protein
MIAGTVPNDNQQLVGTNLVARHAYTVVGVAGTDRVVLRNPYGRQELGSDGVDDGTFSIRIDQFQRYFDLLEIGAYDGAASGD